MNREVYDKYVLENRHLLEDKFLKKKYKEIESQVREKITIENNIKSLNKKLDNSFNSVDKRFVKMAEEVRLKNEDFKEDANYIKNELSKTNDKVDEIMEAIHEVKEKLTEEVKENKLEISNIKVTIKYAKWVFGGACSLIAFLIPFLKDIMPKHIEN